jgi:demethylmenaquinone methyltransferase/2-methoxy-6-polyprenyl-1,4-benzoquinol methylase
MTFALRRQAGNSPAKILGVDFSHAMLQRADGKSAGTSLRWVEADALCLPFSDQQFDMITAAFGFRNLADYDAGLREMVRLLRLDGECGIRILASPVV